MTFSLPRDIPVEVPLPRNAKPWLSRWKDKGFLNFFLAILVESGCSAPHLGMEVQAGDQGMVCTDAKPELLLSAFWLSGFIPLPSITSLFPSQDGSVTGSCFGLCAIFCLLSPAGGGEGAG